jgi:hypothetical protein
MKTLPFQNPQSIASVAPIPVEKTVDYSRESGEEIEIFPLAKRRSFLLETATPYLSMTIK